jgi:hypothetical protein
LTAYRYVTVIVAWAVLALPPQAPRFERLLALDANEVVNAYARISPTGRFLAFASRLQTSEPTEFSVKVVDLKTKATLFAERGVDAYWSNDETRLVFLSNRDLAHPAIAVRHLDTGRITRGIAPVDLGDYYSWAQPDGRDLLLTIKGNFFYLDGDQGVMPAGSIPACSDIGTGERPLSSKDGLRVTTFVRGYIVVRNRSNCDFVFNTGLKGAKADFSWDGRYIAFHAPKADQTGYEVRIVDIQRRTVRTLTGLPGSSLYPSWTQDGRLCFSYYGSDYRGFVMASDPLGSAAIPLPTARETSDVVRWSDVFSKTPWPIHRLNMVLVWATWNAHSPQALVDFQRASRLLSDSKRDVGMMTAVDPVGAPEGGLPSGGTGLFPPMLPLSAYGFSLTEAVNQIPATIAFRDGVQVDRRLGALSFTDLLTWVDRLKKSGSESTQLPGAVRSR